MKRILVLLGLGALLFAPGARAEDGVLTDRLRLRTVSPDSPKISDVCFSSRWFHPTDAADTNSTLESVKAFHVTKVMWMYLGEKGAGTVAAIKKLGVTVQGTINTDVNQSLPEAKDVKKDINGNPIIWRWDRMHFCPNAPSARPFMLQWAQRLLQEGVDEIQVDDPDFWAFSQVQLPHEKKPRIEKCYCDYCMEGFRKFLEKQPPETLRAAGIANPATFNYREYLLSQNLPPNRLDTPLEKLYDEFSKASLSSFWSDFRAGLDASAGRHVPISCNDFGGIWQPVVGPFDFGVAELPEAASNPKYIYERLREDFALGKGQVFTAVSRSVAETRKRIATVTACGGNVIVPWDVFLGVKAPRYFGTPTEYADIYGFIRAAAGYLDGYEDAAVAWNTIDDDRYTSPPFQVVGSPDVFAMARVNPRDRSVRAVVHLVDWGEKAAPFTLKINMAAIQGDGDLAFELLVPKAYNEEEHELAQSKGDYSSFAVRTDLAGVKTKDGVCVSIPALSPWGILVVRDRE